MEFKKLLAACALFLALYPLAMAQNVGVGTTTPGSKLSVNGSLSIGAAYSATAGPANGAIIQSKVGIGTTVPGNMLDVQGGNIDASGYIQAGGTGGGALMFSGVAVQNGGATSGGLSFNGRPRIGDWGQSLTIGEPNGTNGGIIMQVSASGIFTGTSTGIANVPVLRNCLDNGAGNVGIGTLAPTSALQVMGLTTTTTFKMTNGAANLFVLQSDALGNGTWVNPNTLAVNNIYNTDGALTAARTVTMAADNLTFSATSGNLIYTPTTGRMGIGTAAPGNLLDVQGGNIDASGYLQAGGTGGGALLFSGAVAQNGGAVSGGLSFNGRPRIGDWGNGLAIGEPNGTNGDLIINVTASGVYTGSSTAIGAAPTLRNCLDNGAGNVGIGTLAPTSTLQVVGLTSTTTFKMTNGAANLFVMQSDALGNATWVNPNTINVNNIYDIDGTLTGNRIVTMAADNLTFTSASGNLIFNPTTTGKVGIGTAAPGNLLDVQGGNIDASGYIQAGGTGGGAVLFSGAVAQNGGAVAGGASFFGRPRIGDWGNGLAIGEPNGTNGNMILNVTATGIYTGSSTAIGAAPTLRNCLDNGVGMVGIGTLNPTSALQVIGQTTTTTFRMTNGAANNFIMQSDALGNATWVNPNTITVNNIYNTDGALTGARTMTMAADNMTFSATSGNLIFSPSTTGKVGIGTAAPGNLLDVQGGNIDASGYIQAGGTSGGAVLFSGAVAQNGGAVAGGASFFGRPRMGDWGNGLAIGEPNGTNGGIILDISGTAIYTGTSTAIGVAPTLRNCLDNGAGNVGIGTLNPTSPLQVIGTTQTTNFKMTAGAGNTFIMQSDALGNASWVNPTTIAAQNIYNIDGTLTAARTVTMANDNLTFSATSGNLIFNPSTTGKVGIGTAGPGNLLDVQGGNIDASGYVQSGGPGGGALIFSGGVAQNGGAVAGGASFWGRPRIGDWGNGLAIGEPNGTNGGIILDINGGAIYTGTSTGIGAVPTLRNCLDNGAGMVGIGTLNPTTPLQVIGTTQTTNFRMTAGAVAGDVLQSDALGNATWVNPNLLETYVNIYNTDASLTGNRTMTMGGDNMTFSATSGNLIFLPSSTGKMGVGTAAPGNMLDVQGGNIDASGYIQAGGTGGGALLFSGAVAQNGGAMAGGASFFGRPRIGDWGNGLVIGEPNGTNGGMVLEIQGGAIYTGIAAAIGTAPALNNCLDNGSGFMGVGTTTPAYLLSVNGQPGCNGFTQFTNYSDRRLKKDITPVANCLEQIMKLRPVQFTYNQEYMDLYKDGAALSRVQKGFIAQEVKEVFPEMVGTTKVKGKEYYDLNLSNLQVYLVKATQEQQDRIVAQQKTIENQKALIEALKKENNQTAGQTDALQSDIDKLKASIEDLRQMMGAKTEK